MRRYVTADLVQKAISKVVYVRNEIKRGSQLGGSAIVLSTDDLLTFCRAFMDRPIVLHEHPDNYANHKVKSCYLKLNDSYNIIYLSGLNNCWLRFVLCKELFHVLLDDPSNCNSDLDGHVEDLFALNIENNNQKVLTSTQLESVAEIAAMEYLFPLSERKKHTSRELDYMSIAQRYLVPRDYIELYLLSNSINDLSKFNYSAINPDEKDCD